MPRIACTSRMDGRRWRRIIRSRALAAVPLSAPPPYTRYTTCRSSTTTMGRSATAVPRLRAPEVQEADHDRHDRPAHAVDPEGGDAREVRMAVRAEGRNVSRYQVVELAVVRVVRLGPGHGVPVLLQQRVPDQGDVDRGRIDLQQVRDGRMVDQRPLQGQRLQAEQ